MFYMIFRVIIQNRLKGLELFQRKLNNCNQQLTKSFILNDLNPNIMKEIAYRSLNLTHKKENLYVRSRNIIKFGNKSLRSLVTVMELIAWKHLVNITYKL